MRLIVILFCLAFGGWYFGGKAIDSFKLRSASKLQTSASTSDVLPKRSSGFGGLANSINSSVGFGSAREEVPVSVAVYSFKNRLPPVDMQAGGSSSFSVDLPSRSVVVRGPENEVALMVQGLRDLDAQAGSCDVRTWAVYVDKSVGSGWDLTAAIRAVSGARVGFDIGAGSAALSLTGDEIVAALTVISESGDVEVLQRPHLTLLHGVESVVEAIDEVPLPSVSLSANGLSQSSVDYKKVGLRLAVIPTFLTGDRVRLSVAQENGLIGAMLEVADGVSAPIISTQRVSSSVEMEIGQTIILGGVLTDRVTRKKGFLRDVENRQQGFLYVILSTSPFKPVDFDQDFGLESGLLPDLGSVEFDKSPVFSDPIKRPFDFKRSFDIPFDFNRSFESVESAESTPVLLWRERKNR